MLEGNKWRKLNIDEDDAPLPRFGHSAIIYKKQCYIFGGSIPREPYKTREDILIFNLSTNCCNF